MRSGLYLCFCFLTVMLLIPAVYAAEAEHHGTEAGHAESAGLPQLDPTFYASQVFWLFVTFALLYVTFSKKVLPQLSSTIENRRERVDGDLEHAEDLKEEAEKVHEAYEEILDEARKAASNSFAAAEDEMKANVEHSLNKFREKSLTKTQKAEANLTKAKKVALKDMDAIAAEVAAQAAEKIVGIPADIKQAQNVVENINKKAA